MKKWLSVVMGTCVLSFPCFGREAIRYYKEATVVLSQPYHFEGLYPVLDPQLEEYYEFTLNDKFYPTQITHYDKGVVTNNKEGWATFILRYDEEGRLTESGFYKANGKLTLCKSLGFSREVVSYDEKGNPSHAFYNPKGKISRKPKKAFSLDNKPQFLKNAQPGQ